MGVRPRLKPKRLGIKLLAIRQKLGLSQSQLATQLKFDKGAARISEYESGAREPQLCLLLRYAKLSGICTCVLIDDKLNLPKQLSPESKGKHSRHHTSLFEERLGEKGR